MDPELKSYIETHRQYKERPLEGEELIDTLLDAKAVHTESLGNSRWWENEFRVVRIGEKLIGFQWASTTGDDNARDKGWEFDPRTICEVEEGERTEVIKFYVEKKTTIQA